MTGPLSLLYLNAEQPFWTGACTHPVLMSFIFFNYVMVMQVIQKIYLAKCF